MDVAVVAAELTLCLAVDRKGLFAGRADEMVEGLRGLADHEQVGIPPFLAADIGAENSLLALGNLDDLLAAMLAPALIRLNLYPSLSFCRQPIPSCCNSNPFDPCATLWFLFGIHIVPL